MTAGKEENKDKPLRVLFVEDSKTDADYLASLLKNEGFTVTRGRVDTPEALEQALKNATWDVIISDYRMPRFSGPKALRIVRKMKPDIPFVVVSGTVGEEVAVDLMKAGANDFVSKANLNRLVPAIERELRDAGDRTARKQVEKALRESEEKFRNYIEYAPDGMFVVDNAGRFVEVNESACRITGFSMEELERMSIHDLLAKESLDDGLAHFKRVMETGAATSDLWHKHKDGSKRCLTVAAVKLSKTRILGFNNDITDRKKAEEELRGSNERFEKAFHSSPVLMSLSEIDTGKLLDVNDEMARFSGYSRQEMLGRTTFELGLWVTPKKRGEILSAILRAKPVHGMDVEIRDRQDNLHHVLWSGERVSLSGKPCLLASGLDITDRKKAEERMRMFSRQLLVAREEEKKRMASVLHHNVGSLAVGVSAYLNAIADDVRCGKTRDALKDIKRAKKLFNQSVVHLKQIAVELRPPELDILGLSAALRHHFSQVTRLGDVRIHFVETLGRRRVPNNLATIVFRIVQEALTNAIKHGHARKVDIMLSASKKDLSLVVRNDGKPFHAVPKGGSRSPHLGLHMMGEMASAVGGILKIDSAPGRQTTVSVNLPLETAYSFGGRGQGEEAMSDER